MLYPPLSLGLYNMITTTHTGEYKRLTTTKIKNLNTTKREGSLKVKITLTLAG